MLSFRIAAIAMSRNPTLLAASAVLFALGMHIITHALVRVRQYDARIGHLKARDAEVRALIEVE